MPWHFGARNKLGKSTPGIFIHPQFFIIHLYPLYEFIFHEF